MNYEAFKTTYVQKLNEVKQGNESLKQKLNECQQKETQNTAKISKLENELSSRTTPMRVTEETKVDTPKKTDNELIYEETYDKFHHYFDKEMTRDAFVNNLKKNSRINNLDLKGNDDDKKFFQDSFVFGPTPYITDKLHKQNFLIEFFVEMKNVMQPPIVKKLDDDSIFNKEVNDIKFVSKEKPGKTVIERRSADVNTPTPQESANTQYNSVIKKFSESTGLLLKNNIIKGSVLNKIFETDDIKDDETLKNFLLNNVEVEDLSSLNDQLNYVSNTLYDELKNTMYSILNGDLNNNIGGEKLKIVMKIFFQKLFDKDYTLNDFISKQFKKKNVEESLNLIYKYFKKVKPSIRNITLDERVTKLLLYIYHYLVAQRKKKAEMINAIEVINLFNRNLRENFIRQIYDKIDETYFTYINMWDQKEFENFNSQIRYYNDTLKFMNSPIKKETTKNEKVVEKDYFKLEKKDFVGWTDKFYEIDNMIRDYEERFSQLARGLTLSDDETRKFKNNLGGLLDQLLPVYQKQKAQIDAIVTEVKKSLLILQLPIDTNIQEDFLQSNDGVKRKSLSKKNNNNNTLGERKKLRSIKKKRTRSLQKRFRRMNKY
jgi:hypothetical protein